MPEFPTVTPRAHHAFSAGFYPSADFDYEVRILLGACAYGAADAGEVLAVVDTVANNDHDHWFRAWRDLGERLRVSADTAAAAGHTRTAAAQYLRASTYFAVAVNAASGLPTADEVLLPTFRSHRSCWDEFVDTGIHPVERVDIDYEDCTLPGYFFTPSHSTPSDSTPSDSGVSRPTLVMVNGSDGSMSSMWNSGIAAGLARGHNVLVFDGPGQQTELFERGTAFRPDWEAVLTPVVDHLLARPDVDADRLVVYGISQGGFWVTRALASEHRFAAAVLDPGVTDVSASWASSIPSSLMTLFHAGKKGAFDRDMAIGMKMSPNTKRTWAFRARPYGQEGYFDTLTDVHRYTIDDDTAAAITTPLFLADPEKEQFWPGQSAALAARVGVETKLSRFTAAEGADFHCQPLARRLTHERMFDWLDEVMR